MFRSHLFLVPIIALSFLFAGCLKHTEMPELEGHDIKITFIHTSDWHSRLLPYYLKVGESDKALGLDENSPNIGGAARAATLIKRIRAAGGRVVHVDSGDVFQGAPIFNEYLGEVEFLLYSMLHVDAFAVGNHEFDMGVTNYVNKTIEFARFPMLNMNYAMENPNYPGASPLARVTHPYTIANAEGLRVGIIGAGSLGSIVSMYEGGNSLGVTPVETIEMIQFYIDYLRPMSDVIVVVSHLGLRSEKQMERGGDDQIYIEDPDNCPPGEDCTILDALCVSNQRLPGDEQIIANTEGIDVVFGGHLHIVLSPPEVIHDCRPDPSCPQLIDFMERRGCLETTRDPQGNLQSIRYKNSRAVPLMHSGAFLKFVGQMDTVFGKPEAPTSGDPYEEALWALNGWELKAFRQIIHPMDNRIPVEQFDGDTQRILDWYKPMLYQHLPLTRFIAFAPVKIRRFATGYGDSALGNVVSTAIQVRRRVETDFALTNTLGIRSDIEAGPVTIETMYNVFPFENTITTLTLSGSEVKQLLDYVSLRSARRGCQPQAQVAGVTFVMNCNETVRPPYKDAESYESAHRITIGGARFEDPALYGVNAETGKAVCSYDGVRCVSGGPVGAADTCDDFYEPAVSCPDGTAFGEGGCCPAGELCTPLGCGRPITLLSSYTLAANDYIAAGGSGFRVLQFNTTQYNTGIPLRDAVVDFMYINYPGCGATLPDSELDRIEGLKAAADSQTLADFKTAFASFIDSLRYSQSRYAACSEQVADALTKDCSYLERNSDERIYCERQLMKSALDMCIRMPCIEAREEGRIDRVYPSYE
ncbi:bifunctional metallophosphatase/5'-nucleotidase [Myxococcota bacterium]|nr:bifunctional metallophosphatase/5'-nucleotidase [Myxococcota bacterium]